jgi:uncharacterized membrane protein
VVRYLIAYAATALVFFAIDFVWLSTMGGFYRSQIGHLMADQPNLAVAGGFYLLYIAGIVILAISPALTSGSWSGALIAGMVMGAVAYGTYDLTNQSTLRDWPLTVTLIDVVWGTVLTGVAATAGYLASRWLAP